MFPITYASSGLSGSVVHFESQNQEVSETPTWHLWRIKESMAAGRVAAEPLRRVRSAEPLRRVRAAEPLRRVRAAEPLRRERGWKWTKSRSKDNSHRD